MTLLKKAAAFFFIITAFAMALCFTASAMTPDGKIVVVLDPGHGGGETGTCKGSEPEYIYNLKVAEYCRDRLEEHGGFEVYMTRTSNNKKMELVERALFANSKNADILLSIHFDGNDDPRPSGASAYVSVVPRYNKAELAHDILRNIDDATGLGIFYKAVNERPDSGETLYYWSDKYNWSFPNMPEMGELRDYYGILKWNAYCGIPAIIVEHGFLSCPKDRYIIENEDTYRALGEADAEALIAYFTEHTHTFGSVERDFPTNCFVRGKQSEHCKVCFARRNTQYLEECDGKHYWIKGVTVPATCESDGYTEYVCEYTRAYNVGKSGICDIHTYREVTPALGHKYVNVFHDDSYHGHDGKNVYKCENCKATYTDILKSEPHDFVKTDEKKADCVNDGYTLYTCKICQYEEKRVTEKAYGHKLEQDGEQIKTCTEDGYKHYTCSVCGFEEKKVLEAAGHTYVVENSFDGDCLNKSYKDEICSVCGEQLHTEGDYGKHIPSENDLNICSLCGEVIRKAEETERLPESVDEKETQKESASGDVDADQKNLDIPFLVFCIAVLAVFAPSSFAVLYFVNRKIKNAVLTTDTEDNKEDMSEVNVPEQEQKQEESKEEINV